MKAITIKQPWASLICEGIKDVENRTWKTNYRGRILIHAAGSHGKRFRVDLTEEQMKAAFPIIAERCMFENFPFGAIIGSVEIVDCVQDHASVWAEKGVWNWVLANAMLFPQAIPYKGKLMFWDYSGIPNPEFDEDGHKVCMCTMNVEEKAQVMIMTDHFECRYCGGRWYK